MNRFAVYTAIVGGYDNILQPEAVDERFDYILFSNDVSEEKLGIWQVRKIPYTNPDPTRMARWVKTHPEQLLTEYQASVWVDGNIIITSDFVFSRIKDLFDSGVLISSMCHTERNCVYSEADKLILIGWEQERTYLDWTHRLLKEKYPSDNGLWETGFLFRVHSQKIIQDFDRLWWDCIDKYSRRDQLSFPYALWKTKLACPYFLSDHENVRNSPHFKYIYHDTGKNKRLPLSKNTILYYYDKLHGTDKREQLLLLYRKIASSPNPRLIAFLMRQYFRLKLWQSSLKTKRG